MPYHFAAICSTTANLQVLKDTNYDFKSIDKSLMWKEMPFLMAIKKDLAQNVKFIVETDKEFYLELKM